MRWITRAPVIRNRTIAASIIDSIERSVMPG